VLGMSLKPLSKNRGPILPITRLRNPRLISTVGPFLPLLSPKTMLQVYYTSWLISR